MTTQKMPDLGKFVRCEQFINDNNNPTANHFVIYFEHGTILQSYDSVIVVENRRTGKRYLGQDWNYSRTTSKYRGQYLRETTKETEKKLKDGEYLLLDV